MSNPLLSSQPRSGQPRLDLSKLPKHVAIIMDGNRRWALRRKSAVETGHFRGADTLATITEAAADIGIEVLTVFTFSTENWRRPKIEVKGLMKLFEIYLGRMTPNMVKNGVKLSTIGDLSPFPKEVIRELDRAKKATEGGERIELILALNYGGRDDLRRAIVQMVEDVSQNKLVKEDVTEEVISSYLDTRGRPDPELLIRTSGEQRISNFLLWQIPYAEVYTTRVLWPDFTKDDLMDAVVEFQERQRRYGG